MGKYLHLWENKAQHDTYIASSDYIEPYVGYDLENVYYNDPFMGHEYVDLGLPSGTKWATMNVGASSEIDAGFYFQWGDTQGYTADQVGSDEGQKYFGRSDCKFNPEGDGLAFTKYNTTDGKTVLDIEDDAVASNWGGDWHMPTETQFQELIDNTNNELVTINNMKGYKFTNKTDNTKYIFIPSAGEASYGIMDDVGKNGFIWSSSLNNSSVENGRYLHLTSKYAGMGYSRRFNGFPVRGVVG